METNTTGETKLAPTKKSLLRRLLGPVLFTLGFFAALELILHATYAVRNAQVTAVPLPYVIGHDYGPTPPWLGESMFEPDADLLWKNRANLQRRYVDVFSPVEDEADRRTLLRRFWPSLPESWSNNPSWDVALNADGFRTAPPANNKPACRILCLGDSWTFGMNVGQEQAYPQRLQTLLREAMPAGDFEVLNFGVLGYSSFQGLELLKQKAPVLKPDVVILGFGMNDAKPKDSGHGFNDKEMAAYQKTPTLGDRVGRLLRKSETVNLLAYLARRATYEPKPLDHYLKEEKDDDQDDDGEDEPYPPPPAAVPAAEGKVKDPYDWLRWSRVPPTDYEQNIREMVRLARSGGAAVILLYNELWVDGPYQKRLEKIAASEGVPLVNSSVLVAEARRKMHQELERKLDLVPAEGGPVREKGVEVVFRVSMSGRPVPRGVFITGPHTELGDCVPNKVALYDDGTHGDQKAGDGVWSRTAIFRAGVNVHYVYTNSGTEGQWQGLDVPHIREIEVEARHRGKRVYLPIETFGKVSMQADGWHPNAEGYDLIAQAVCGVLQQNEKVSGASQKRR